jgi:peroxiredoxin (alkyl hydroperoxide reductase subunit C)
MRKLFVTPWILGLSLAGCEEPPASHDTAPFSGGPLRGAATATASATGSTTTTAMPATTTTSAEALLPHAYVSDDKLGTLPPGIGIAVGQRAPDFTAKDHTGKDVTLASLLATRDVLLLFHRGVASPHCRFQIHKLSMNADGFKAQGIQIALVSSDSIEETAKTKSQVNERITVLSDVDRSAQRAFRVLDGDTTVPAIFLVMKDGTVKWAHADADPTTRPKIDKLLEVVPRAL